MLRSEASVEGILQALLNPDLVQIAGLTFRVTGLALLASTLTGVPIGAWLGLARFRGKHVATAALYTGMGFPPVVIGLFVYLLLSRSGPLGGLGWLFTPAAMIVAQAVIAFPLVAGLSMSAVMGVDQGLPDQVLAMGATPNQIRWTILREARVGVTAAIVAAFGGAISEVGAAMLVGGNIAGQTRVVTTAIVQYTRQGEFSLALALGVLLIAATFAANTLLLRLQGRFR